MLWNFIYKIISVISCCFCGARYDVDEVIRVRPVKKFSSSTRADNAPPVTQMSGTYQRELRDIIEMEEIPPQSSSSSTMVMEKTQTQIDEEKLMEINKDNMRICGEIGAIFKANKDLCKYSIHSDWTKIQTAVKAGKLYDFIPVSLCDNTKLRKLIGTDQHQALDKVCEFLKALRTNLDKPIYVDNARHKEHLAEAKRIAQVESERNATDARNKRLGGEDLIALVDMARAGYVK